ncbi:hypothetical protein ACFFRR_001563 [Megaselia abdita]
MRLSKLSHHMWFRKNDERKSDCECGLNGAPNKRVVKKRKTKQNLGGTVFRCCLPCRGGSTAAPATSPSNSPIQSEELMNNIVSEGQQHTNTISSTSSTGEPGEQEEEPTSPLSNQLSEFLENSVEDFLTTINKSSPPVANIDTTTRKTSTSTTSSSSSPSSTPATPPSRICQPQTSSPLPHIKEEEESENTARSPTEIDSVKLLTSSSRNLSDEQYSSTPSPHSKHKNRKPHKTSWGSRFLPSVGISAKNHTNTSTETLGSSLSGSTVIGSSGGSLTSNTTSILSTSVPLSTNTSLIIQPKMQAEQGSIGDLQKYHGRYLKNRRHTLANVR